MTGTVSLKIQLDSDKLQNLNEKDSQSLEIDINIRPRLIETLNDLCKSFQIVSFTASD